ncbi:flavin monoamine oxidase family protein [Rhodococcus koreensis]
MKDVVIVGAGLAGLSAAWRTRYYDTLVLESGDRVGGRVRSERRGKYWMNWGGHMYAGPGSATSALLSEVGITAVDIPGVLTGTSMNGKLLTTGSLATYPLRLPMPMAARKDLCTTGTKIVWNLLTKYMKAVRPRPGESTAARQQRIFDFENNRSFRDFIGKNLHPDAEALLDATTGRVCASIDEQSAGQGLGYFTLVLGSGAGLYRYIVGGPSTLTSTISAALGDRVQLGAEVHEIVNKDDSVVVRYRQNGKELEVEARTVVVATTASVAHRVGVDLPVDLRDALGQIKYGPHVVSSFVTNETTRSRWDDVYCIAAPKKSFSIALNNASIIRGSEKERQPGGAFFTFSPGAKGRALFDKSDEEVARIHQADLADILDTPNFADTVIDAGVSRWREGSPYCFPGRARIQPTLMRGASRVLLAGDYLGSLSTETAVASGSQAGQDALSILGTDHLLKRTPNVARAAK